MDFTLLALFIPTIFLISISPGMCMTLAMTLGISVGYKKTLWMMWGELLGVALVAIAAALGVAKIMFSYPEIFTLLKIFGAGYLTYIAINMWQAKGKLAIDIKGENARVSKQRLLQQGFITAISNPKGWAFMVSLLPPFINSQQSLVPQLIVLVAIILMSEFICMTLYATGGKTLARYLTKNNKISHLNKISACLMMIVALWLLLG
ncbi:LysE family translocator [Colwellia sp. MB3u-28]|nr:LysE family translocator [Colwellia sp. MB02u-7]MBA6237624.1 LysE family translocator [Colwellia sp. MB02u-11]MBA6256041.1 LysE family translocator [Colwellia sp. MB3u-28]MBA6259986.1 LysE family translocator [Colwellia sp. MB3u-41]MBA6300575.1 LysE family translocator [Colwellia sp. MB3u-22]MBA6303112.1 LysE family translocator [Colwellia sp. MB02u-14]MBA6310665.1 LysE family translocator [Colwellia sp. MB3u-64]